MKINKIILETSKNKEIGLTIDEAKELHKQLDEIFGKNYVASTPIIIGRDDWFRPYNPVWYTTSCKVDSASGLTVTYSAD